VPTRLVVYPGETHSLSTPSHIQDRIQRSLDWYDTHLRK
jgi:dipeptidyl aminopeptidase/acylaminoacyl peptidase